MHKPQQYFFTVSTPNGPKTIGRLESINGTLMLVKRVSRKKHFHRNFAAWGLQAEAIPRLKEADVKAVRLVVDDGSIFEASLTMFQAYGFLKAFPPHGEQVFLREVYWRKLRPAKKEPLQLALFEVGA